MKRTFIKKIVFIASIICLFTFAACTGNNAEDLFETARFEELQHNREHAEQLYDEIIRKYPDSEYAGKAKERLAELQNE